MPSEARKTVWILLKASPGDADAFQPKTLWGVPKSVAERIKSDFAQYEDPKFDGSPHQTYRYKKGGEQQIVALDFRKVFRISVMVYYPLRFPSKVV